MEILLAVSPIALIITSFLFCSTWAIVYLIEVIEHIKKKLKMRNEKKQYQCDKYFRFIKTIYEFLNRSKQQLQNIKKVKMKEGEKNDSNNVNT